MKFKIFSPTFYMGYSPIKAYITGFKMKIEKSSNIKKTPVVHEGAKDVEIRWLISKAFAHSPT